MNKDVWNEWRANPHTQEVFRALEKYCAELSTNALEQSLVMDSVEATAMAAARHQGQIEGIKGFIDGDFIEDE